MKLFERILNGLKLALGSSLCIGLALSLFSFQPASAASKRGKTAAGVIFGGGLGAGIAGAAGSAKWVPLGFGIGGLAGGLLVRAIRKSNERRKAEQPSYGKHKRKRYESVEQEKQSSFKNDMSPHQRRHIRSYNQ